MALGFHAMSAPAILMKAEVRPYHYPRMDTGRRSGVWRVTQYLPVLPLSWLSMRRDSWRSVPTTCRPPASVRRTAPGFEDQHCT